MNSIKLLSPNYEEMRPAQELTGPLFRRVKDSWTRDHDQERRPVCVPAFGQENPFETRQPENSPRSKDIEIKIPVKEEPSKPGRPYSFYPLYPLHYSEIV